MFDFHVSQLMEIALPTTLLRQIIRYTLTDQNMTGVAAIHHLLCDVDARPGNVFALVRILDLMHRTAMNSHSHRQTRLGAQRLADLQRAFDRFFD